MTRKLRDDCFLHDSDRLTHAEAVAILRESMVSVVGVEKVPVDEAVARILAEDVIAPRDIPGHDNAAVDGYTFAFSDYDADKGSTFKVSARAAAGHAVSDKIEQGTAARIFTGAAMPDGMDSVVMQDPGRIEAGRELPAGRRRREARRGDVSHRVPAAPAGCRLRGSRREGNALLLQEAQGWGVIVRR
jgi:molybdopterin molybdotransferase